MTDVSLGRQWRQWCQLGSGSAAATGSAGWWQRWRGSATVVVAVVVTALRRQRQLGNVRDAWWRQQWRQYGGGSGIAFSLTKSNYFNKWYCQRRLWIRLHCDGHGGRRHGRCCCRRRRRQHRCPSVLDERRRRVRRRVGGVRRCVRWWPPLFC